MGKLKFSFDSSRANEKCKQPIFRKICYNIKTKEYNNYDVKTESFRLSDTKYGNKNKDRINRAPNKRQKHLSVKILYVGKDGKITIK